MGRKSVIDKWKDEGKYEENISLIEDLSANNVPLSLIAETLEINEQTLTRLKKKNDRVKDALLQGKLKLHAKSYRELVRIAEDDDTSEGIKTRIWEKFYDKTYREIHGVSVTGVADGVVDNRGSDGEGQNGERVFVLSEED